MAFIKVGSVGTSPTSNSNSNSTKTASSTGKSVSIKKPGATRMTKRGGCKKCGR